MRVRGDQTGGEDRVSKAPALAGVDNGSPGVVSPRDALLRSLLLRLYELEAEAYDTRLYVAAELIGIAALATGEELAKGHLARPSCGASDAAPDDGRIEPCSCEDAAQR